jgi:hypothetical protein
MTFVQKFFTFNVDEIDATTGVNFINNLRVTFTLKDPESTKKESLVVSLFGPVGSANVKARHKHVDEIDPRHRQIHRPA